MLGTIPNPLRTNVNKADLFPALMELEKLVLYFIPKNIADFLSTAC